MTSEYVPLGLLVSAIAPYHTVVASPLVAAALVVLMSVAVVGIAAHLVLVSEATLVCALVATLPNPVVAVASSMRKPHVLLVMAAGAAIVPALAAIVLTPFTSVVVAPLILRL